MVEYLQSYQIKGRSYFALGEYELALENHQYVVERGKQYDIDMAYNGFLDVANVLCAQKKYEAALQILHEALTYKMTYEIPDLSIFDLFSST